MPKSSRPVKRRVLSDASKTHGSQPRRSRLVRTMEERLAYIESNLDQVKDDSTIIRSALSLHDDSANITEAIREDSRTQLFKLEQSIQTAQLHLKFLKDNLKVIEKELVERKESKK